MPAALLGLGIAMALTHAVPANGLGVVWIGAPAACIALRQILLPKLTPQPPVKAASGTTASECAAYGLMILGGVIALISGLFVFLALGEAKHRDFALVCLVPLAVGTLLATLGFRLATRSPDK